MAHEDEHDQPESSTGPDGRWSPGPTGEASERPDDVWGGAAEVEMDAPAPGSDGVTGDAGAGGGLVLAMTVGRLEGDLESLGRRVGRLTTALTLVGGLAAGGFVVALLSHGRAASAPSVSASATTLPGNTPSGSTGGSTGGSTRPPTGPLSSTTLSAIEATPISPLATPHSPISSPTLRTGAELTAIQDGRALPVVFYYGAEWCPFCAAERWPLTIALSRFGTFTHLGSMYSSPTDGAPNTPTLTYAHAQYHSPYLIFQGLEGYSNTPDPGSSPPYQVLHQPDAAQQALLNRFGFSGFPFLDIANRWVIDGSAYDPSLLAGQTTDEVAARLTRSEEAYLDIRYEADVLSAEICTVTNQQPGSVCANPVIASLERTLRAGPSVPAGTTGTTPVTSAG